MGLISDKIKKKNEFFGFKFKNLKKTIVKKVAAGLAAGVIGATSLFGFVGCAKQPEETPIVETETNKEIEMLKEMVESLNLIVAELGASEEIQAQIQELNTRIQELNTQIQELESQKNVTEDDLSEKMTEVMKLIISLQAEVYSIKDRLIILENPEDKPEESPEVTPQEPPVSVEKLEKIENKLAKLNAKLAIKDSFTNYYNRIQFDDGFYGYTAPNGEVVVIDRAMNKNHKYYNHDENMMFVSNEGEEVFGVADDQAIYADFGAMITSELEDEGFVLDKEKTNENCYVFENEEGEKITINVESGIMTSAEMCSNSLSDNISVGRSCKEEFEAALKSCKKVLKSIGLFESYKKSLDNSLQYKYAEALATCEGEYGKMTGSGVFSGFHGVTETVNGDSTSYSTITKDEQYVCVLDKDGNKTDEILNEDENSMDIAQSFKDMCTPERSGFCYRISLDEETGTYTLTSHGDEETFVSQIEIKFNADLSIDCKVTFEKEVISYHIKEIGIERYNEVFLRINEICEQAKNQNIDLNP